MNGTISLQVSGTASVDLVGLLTVTGGFTLTEFEVVDPVRGAGATGVGVGVDGVGDAAGGRGVGDVAVGADQQRRRVVVDGGRGHRSQLRSRVRAAHVAGHQRQSDREPGAARADPSGLITVAAIETLAGVDFTAPTLNGTISLQVSGTASVDLVGLLTVTGGFTLTEFDASSTVRGAGATGLALELTASATLPGAGVSGTLQLVQISNAAGLSWMAVEATDLNFDLAFGPLTLQVTNGSLIVNQAPLGQTRQDFTVAAIETLAGVDFTAPTLNGTISLQVSGTASVDLVGLLTVTGGFTLTEFDASTTFAGAGAHRGWRWS